MIRKINAVTTSAAMDTEYICTRISAVARITVMIGGKKVAIIASANATTGDASIFINPTLLLIM